MNDDANIAFAREAPDGGRLSQPVLFVNGDWDVICSIVGTRQGDPMCALHGPHRDERARRTSAALEREAELLRVIRTGSRTRTSDGGIGRAPDPVDLWDRCAGDRLEPRRIGCLRPASVTVVHLLVDVCAVLVIFTVALSVLRSLVLPRGIPTRCPGSAILASTLVSSGGFASRRRADYQTRDRLLALQAPLGVSAQLALWAGLLVAAFSALFWATSGGVWSCTSIAHGIELGGSSTFTLGTDSPSGFVPHLVAFAAAGVGLIRLTLVITYLPTL